MRTPPATPAPRPEWRADPAPSPDPGPDSDRRAEADVDWVGEVQGRAPRRGQRPLWWGITRAAAAKVTAVVLTLGAVGIGAWKLAPSPAAVHVPEVVLAGASAPIPGQEREPGPAPDSGHGREAGEVFVHVAGAVLEPGLVELPAHARRADALELAAGPREDADLDAVNLAAVVVDGEQIYVPTIDEAQPPGGGGLESSAGAVKLNTANAQELQRLPGIGPVLAERIVAHRGSHGEFASVDDLQQVTGIGPALMAGVREDVTL